MTNILPELSIIIPVYNIEKYIGATLDSCLCQNVPVGTVEIICVNDGSQDNSCEVIRAYCEKYENVFLENKENGGVSSARNRGIELARGKYIWFVDGDDLVASNCIEIILKVMNDSDADIFHFGIKHFLDENAPNLPYIDSDFEYETCSDSDNMFDFLASKGGGGVWSEIYKRETIVKNEIRFNESIKFSEDILFDLQVILASQICAKTDVVLYYYRQRNGSAMHSDNVVEHIKSMYLLANEYERIAEEQTDEKRKKIIKNKRDFAVKAMLFSVMRTGDVKQAAQILGELKKIGFYPYPLKIELLQGNKTGKQTIINLISFFFPCKLYFMFCVKLVSIKKQLGRKHE